MDLLKTLNWALAQHPIGEKGTVLPPISGIGDGKQPVNRENLLSCLQSVLNNAQTTNTGWTLNGKEKKSFMLAIRDLDFEPALQAETIKQGVTLLLNALKETLNVNVVNLTTHAIIIKIGGFQKTIEPSGSLARVEANEEYLGERYIGEGPSGLQTPIVARTFGEVENLPAPEPGTIYLVSSLVLAAVPNRTDVFAPDTGDTAERNDKGQIVSVCRLIGNLSTE